MNLFERIICNTARKINSKYEQKDNTLDIIKTNNIAYIKKILYDYIDGEAIKFESKPCHIKAGDITLFNKYHLKYNDINGWDKGSSSYLRFIDYEAELVTAKIISIEVNKSYAYECVDLYMYKYLDINKNTDEKSIIQNYSNHLSKFSRNNNNIFFKESHVGLYKCANFEASTSDIFKPNWGLNVYSFLAEGTPEYEDTKKLWEMEISNTLLRNQYKIQELNFENELNQTKLKYKYDN